ncbi:MAG: nucleotidyltransferase family protein [Halothiobacillaceae bacterium]
MRLNHQQAAVVLANAREILGDDTTVAVFGSRLDDSRRGGDLDLLVEATQRPTLLQRAELKLRLEQALGMPVDVITRARGTQPTPFQTLAMLRGIRLEQVK